MSVAVCLTTTLIGLIAGAALVVTAGADAGAGGAVVGGGGAGAVGFATAGGGAGVEAGGGPGSAFCSPTFTPLLTGVTT